MTYGIPDKSLVLLCLILLFGRRFATRSRYFCQMWIRRRFLWQYESALMYILCWCDKQLRKFHQIDIKNVWAMARYWWKVGRDVWNDYLEVAVRGVLVELFASWVGAATTSIPEWMFRVLVPRTNEPIAISCNFFKVVVSKCEMWKYILCIQMLLKWYGVVKDFDTRQLY